MLLYGEIDLHANNSLVRARPRLAWMAASAGVHRTKSWSSAARLPLGLDTPRRTG
jgi:hypothetical protein